MGARVSAFVDRRLRFWMVLVVYILLGTWYSLSVPAFETPDEIYHYAFSRHLSQGNWLPVQSDVSTGPWEQEGSQAPLYYMITGGLTAGVDQSDFASISVFNPRANMGNPLYPGNKNRMLYSGAPRPLRGSNLALHLGRWVSLLLGACSVWLVYRTATYAFGDGSRRAVLAALLVALTPQFLFISASFSNDSMVVAASTAVTFWLARILVSADRRAIHVWEWVVLGILLGIAALSKLQGLGLCALAGLVGLVVARKRGSWRVLFAAALGSAIPLLFIAGWWYWRNLSLYGDWTGVGHLTAINGLRQKPLDLDDFWLEFRGLRYSFWGLFGWFNILLPSWFYAVMDLMSIVAVGGAAGAILVALRRHGTKLLKDARIQVKLMLLAWIAVAVALLVYWMMTATGSQGRLLFPAIGAIAVWFVVGLDFWAKRLPRPARQILWASVPSLLLAMSIYGVAVAVPDAYARPRAIKTLPSTAIATDITYGENDLLELLALETPPGRYHPGESAPVTLYLSAPSPVNRDYELFVQILDDNGEILGNITTHPGWGTNPTTLWQPGAIYKDEYQVPITGAVAPFSPLLARVYVGFIDPDTQPELNHPITARDNAGNEITPMVGAVLIAPSETPSVEGLELSPMEVTFADTLAVSGIGAPSEVAAGSVFTTTLLWSALAQPPADYTLFLHLLDEDGQFVAGSDQTPAPDSFPTSHWADGERVVSRIPMATDGLVPGDYELWLGLYESSSQGETRLPVTNSDGRVVENDMVLIGSVALK